MTTTNRIPTESEYLAREQRILDKQLSDVEAAPLADRREGFQAYADTLANCPEIIVERIGWLFEGTYGRGPYDRARKWLAYANESPKRRLNAVKVNCCRLIAALDHGCTARDAVKAWKQLTADQQASLDVLLTNELSAVEL